MQGENHFPPLEKAMLERIRDKIEMVQSSNLPQVTDFLDPHQQQVVESYLKTCKEVKFMTYGGYPGAERAKIAVMPSNWIAESVDLGISLVEVKGSPKFKELTHRDYLGAALNLGLKREKLGDIIVGEQSAVIIIDEGVTSFLLQNLSQVNTISVALEEISPEKLVTPEENSKIISGTVASLRLDAVAGLGFGYSRSKIARVIKADQVKLNWQRVNDPSSQLKTGDVISLKGRGRIVLEDILGESKKGRLRIVVKKVR